MRQLQADSPTFFVWCLLMRRRIDRHQTKKDTPKNKKIKLSSENTFFLNKDFMELLLIDMPRLVQQVIFNSILLVTALLFSIKAKEIYRNIKMGKAEDRSDQPQQRLKNMTLLALGQKKMFRNMIPAVFHLCIYVAFLVTQIELIEIILDGMTGIHRIFWPMLGGFYTFIISFIELLSVFALVATIVFLSRRNLLKVPRFQMDEMSGWPKLDGNIILYVELFLVFCIFTMNTADMVLHNGEYGFLVSGMLMPLFSGFSEGTLHFLERFGWWGHIVAVFAFLIYIPFSKHLHIVLAFPNAYFGALDGGANKGEMANMPRITEEIKLMMDPSLPMPEEDPNAAPARFGAKDVEDLSWKSLLDAYTCTECGRCTDACPANQTGKLLSPRKIMMATRDRLEEKGREVAKNGPEHDDGKALIHDYISAEEVKACTTCNACVEECPVSINPVNIILELRRYLILEEANSPEEWNLMFGNVETNGAVWKLPASDRMKWIDEMNE